MPGQTCDEHHAFATVVPPPEGRISDVNSALVPWNV
jgi:hypothetical protein